MCLFLLCLRIVRFAPLFYTYRTPQSGFLLFFLNSLSALSPSCFFSLSSLRFFSLFLFRLYLLFFFLSFFFSSLSLHIYLSLSLSLVLFVLTLSFSSISLSLILLLSPSLFVILRIQINFQNMVHITIG